MSLVMFDLYKDGQFDYRLQHGDVVLVPKLRFLQDVDAVLYFKNFISSWNSASLRIKY